MPFSSIMSWRLSCIPLHLWTLYSLALTLSCKSVDGGCWKRCSSSFVNKYALKSLDFLMCNFYFQLYSVIPKLIFISKDKLFELKANIQKLNLNIKLELFKRIDLLFKNLSIIRRKKNLKIKKSKKIFIQENFYFLYCNFCTKISHYQVQILIDNDRKIKRQTYQSSMISGDGIL
ncbi:hypothetical protein BpHYR1_040581 [Brachionus plicatilis]|uniref:Uncharacterized protein n=1 Tax=Brachionus plicatilis TaxID=10195 RepID=A0A3M7T0I7_BRAPC|nr:hypothetical protein BpHYR1_040581 [Brachionus plicatilis]